MARISISEQIAQEERSYRDRKERLRNAAKTFAGKVAGVKGIREVALCGSVVTADPYPNDIDIAIVIDALADLPAIARAARQISSTYHGWEVFVLRADRTYLGRICHRKQCPTQTARCDQADRGAVPHLGNLADFDFDPFLFLAPPIEILWNRESKSLLIEWKQTLGPQLAEQEEYRPIKLKCCDCGKQFLFSIGEQKHFAKNGFREPKRCEPCRIRKEFGADAAETLREMEEEEK